MKNLKLFFAISVLFCISEGLYSQQTPIFSQYMVNKYLVNPAVAGGSGITDFNLVAREQYTGFENAPRTFALTAQSRILNDSYIMRKLRIRKKTENASRFTNVGVGGSIFSDRNGIVSKTGLQLSYAYHINFNNRFQLSMGLSGSAYQYKLDDSDAVLVNYDDPILNGEKKQFWIPDASFGAFITNNQLYGGITITDIVGSNLKLGKDPIKDNFSSLRNYILLGGYKMNLNENFKIEPSFLLRATSLSRQLDLNAKVYYIDSYWLGVSYRSNNTLVTMIGFNVDFLQFGYAYDANFGNIKTYSGGSHEIILGFRFGENSTKRFRWIKKDEMDFEI